MSSNPNGTTMRKTLGLTGVTVNAMALIAPGAFLWITFQLQAAAGMNGAGMDKDIWSGVLFALIIAFLTALSFAELARRYPDAGAGGSYYFAEKAFLDRDEPAHRRFARASKFITGWAAHLFYWVYPGVMVAMMATLVAYLCGQFGITVSPLGLVAVAVVFAAFVGFIAVRGITGSTVVSMVINIIQLVSLVGFSVLAIAFRLTNPLGADGVGSSGGRFGGAPPQPVRDAVPIHDRHPDPGRVLNRRHRSRPKRRIRAATSRAG